MMATGNAARAAGGGSPGRAPQPARAPLSRAPLSRVAVARTVQLVGLFDVAIAIIPTRLEGIADVAQLLPTTGIVSARAGVAVIGSVLIYLGLGLRRGKRRAWQIATALAAVAVALHLTRGPDLAAAAVSAALLVVLVATWSNFRAEPDPSGRWRAARLFLGFLGAGFALGLLEIALRAGHLRGHPGVAAWAAEAGWGLVGVDGPVRFQRDATADLVSFTTGAFGALALATAVVVLLRSGPSRRAATDADEAHLRELLDRYGADDSLGYFALRVDKSLVWAPNRMAAVAYRPVNGVSLAAGDPLGVPSAWPEAIDAWLADSERHGWTPAVLGCGDAGGRAYRKRGLDVIELGDEAIITVGSFTLDGRAMRSVRQAVNRIQRAGYTCSVTRQRDLPPGTLQEVTGAAERFRDGPVERGFSMALSRLGDPRDDGCVLVLARDGAGKLRGLLQFVPWGRDGLSLDLMRGDRAADNGLTEFMVAEAVAAAPRLGVSRLSLNFAVLRSVFARAEQLGAGPVLRLSRRLLLLASKFWQIESLYRANAKYLPDWQPRYLCFPVARDLPRIAVAALIAESFLTFPRLAVRRRHEYRSHTA